MVGTRKRVDGKDDSSFRDVFAKRARLHELQEAAYAVDMSNYHENFRYVQ